MACERNLPKVLAELPASIPGISIIETQIIDDGSTDNTYQVAVDAWVDHIVQFRKNRGLWNAFKAWVENALRHGADIVVNTDADNQYPSSYITDLVQPIIAQKADIVIWNRNPTEVEHFKRYKKKLQWLWNIVVSALSGESMPDAVSGFRAYSRDSLFALNVTAKFSYVIDTILQAHKKGLKIDRVDIHTNLPTRPSRLFKNIRQHIKKSTANIVRVYAMYEPLKTFLFMSMPFFILGWYGVIRYLIAWIWWNGNGMIQSLIISGILITIAFNLFSLGILGDIIAKNRSLVEENMRMTKKICVWQRKWNMVRLSGRRKENCNIPKEVRSLRCEWTFFVSQKKVWIISKSALIILRKLWNRSFFVDPWLVYQNRNYELA